MSFHLLKKLGFSSSNKHLFFPVSFFTFSCWLVLKGLYLESPTDPLNKNGSMTHFFILGSDQPFLRGHGDSRNTSLVFVG